MWISYSGSTSHHYCTNGYEICSWLIGLDGTRMFLSDIIPLPTFTSYPYRHVHHTHTDIYIIPITTCTTHPYRHIQHSLRDLYNTHMICTTLPILHIQHAYIDKYSSIPTCITRPYRHIQHTHTEPTCTTHPY